MKIKRSFFGGFLLYESIRRKQVDGLPPVVNVKQKPTISGPKNNTGAGVVGPQRRRKDW